MKQNNVKDENVCQKAAWSKPALVKMDVAAITKSGSSVQPLEDPNYTFYGPS